MKQLVYCSTVSTATTTHQSYCTGSLLYALTTSKLVLISIYIAKSINSNWLQGVLAMKATVLHVHSWWRPTSPKRPAKTVAIDWVCYVCTYLHAYQDQFATYQYSLQITRLDVIFLAGGEFPNVNSNFNHDTPSVGYPFNLRTED